MNSVGTGVGVLVIKDGKILLGRRRTSELEGRECWTLPGGHIEFGETFEEAAKREVLEETGMLIRSATVVCVNTDKSELAHFVTVGLLGGESVGSPNAMEPEKIAEWRWFAMDALPDLLFAPSRNVIDCYLAGIPNKC